MDVSNDPQYRTADGSALRIWKDAAQNKFLSEREGRAIFDEVIFVEVISPGSGNSTPVFELKRTFAPEMNHPQPLLGSKWAEYKQFVDDFEKSEEHDTSLAGTPLAQWAEMTRAMAASLKAQSIFTLEALANLPDTKLSLVGPDGRTWREKAKAYIENAKNSAYATTLAADLERTKAEIVTRDEQIAALAAQVEALQNQFSGAGAGPEAAKVKNSAKAPADII